jgi:hypothetical protein
MTCFVLVIAYESSLEEGGQDDGRWLSLADEATQNDVRYRVRFDTFAK